MQCHRAIQRIRQKVSCGRQNILARQIFRAFSQDSQDLERDVYVPNIDLKFDSDLKMSIFKCREEQMSLRRHQYFPLLGGISLSSLIVYKSVFAYTGFIWPLACVPPTWICFILFQNIKSGLNGTVKEIKLSTTCLRILPDAFVTRFPLSMISLHF